MGALFSAIVRALAGIGLGYIGNDVYDYVSATKTQGGTPTVSGAGTTAKTSLSNFFQQITKWLVIAAALGAFTYYVVPKLFKFLKIRK